MVDSRDKGARAELAIRDELRKLTAHKWERVPSSGALSPIHLLKGDLYIPGKDNVFCVECKHYAEDQLSTGILTNKNPQLLDWWLQSLRQANQVNKLPLLLFKHDRSKIFAAKLEAPKGLYKNILIDYIDTIMYISLLQDWIEHDKPKFII